MAQILNLISKKKEKWTLTQSPLVRITKWALYNKCVPRSSWGFLSGVSMGAGLALGHVYGAPLSCLELRTATKVVPFGIYKGPRVTVSSWRDGSAVKSATGLPEDQDSIPSSHMVAKNCNSSSKDPTPCYPVLASVGTAHTWYPDIHEGYPPYT